jgi:probable F420-dependent oxidoreductase
MKLGVNMVNFGPAATPEVLAQWVKIVQSLGYHHLMTSDHVTVTPDVAARFPAPFYEPLTTLGWLAGITEDITIGASVIILPYRSPLEVARAFANIDRLSGGRCILGVGVGWAQQEYAALNVPFEKRGRIADEYLSVIRAHWTEERISFDGDYISFNDVHTGPAPAQPGGPPIWVGGGSDAAMRRAVRFGNAWHPFRITVDGLRDKALPKLRAIAEREGMRIPDVCPRIYLRITQTELANKDRVAGEGTVAQIRDDLAALADMGCASVLLDTYTDEGSAAIDPAPAWDMLRVVAGDIYDLSAETVG